MYGADKQRRVMKEYLDNAPVKTTYYSGLYEEVNTVVGNTTTTKKINYITGIDGLTAVFIEETGQTDKMYYVAKDHLGSITGLINSDGTVAAEYSYDPCSVKHGFCECSETKAIVERIPNGEALREGRRRKSSDWLDYDVATFSIINRGYTGHEHLEFFGLINMPAHRNVNVGGNGRIYDPISARFTTPDPFVQNPGFSQDFNRYSYVNNNPMRFTDPSGYMAQGCGYNPNWLRVSNQLEQDQANWNNQISTGGGGGGGKTKFYYYGHSLLCSGTEGNGLRDMDLFTEAGLEFFKENFGVTPVNNGGEWGYNKFIYWTEGDQINYHDDDGTLVHIDLVTTVLKLVFIPFGDGENENSVNDKNKAWVNYASGFSFGAGVGSLIYGGAANGLTTTTSMVANEIRAAKVISGVSTIVSGFGIAGDVIGGTVAGYKMYNDVSNGKDINGWDIVDIAASSAGIYSAIFLATNPIGWAIMGGTTIYFGVRYACTPDEN